MDRPEDYLIVPISDVCDQVLDEFETELSRMNGRILDIGCGPGTLSRDYILPKLPQDSTIVGVDISQQMIDYARKSNADEKKLSFKQMDIETTNLPKEDIENYDNAISFFCLNWVQDITCCYSNIFRMLRPGGNALIHTIVSEPPFFVYPKLAENPKYKPYMENYTGHISPLHFEKNPRKTLRDIVEKVGFEVVHCSVRDEYREFKDDEDLMTLLVSINSFVDRMPEDVKKDFMKEMLEGNKVQALIKPAINGLQKEHMVLKFMYMIAYLKKPKC